MPEWNEAYESVKSTLEEVDVAAGVAAVLAAKDAAEMVNFNIRNFVDVQRFVGTHARR